MTRADLISIVTTLRFEEEDPVWEAEAMGKAVAERLYKMDKLELLQLYCAPTHKKVVSKQVVEEEAQDEVPAKSSSPPSAKEVSEAKRDALDEALGSIKRADWNEKP